MLPHRVSNPGPLTYESGALPIALRGPAGRARENDTSFKDEMLQKATNISYKHHVTND